MNEESYKDDPRGYKTQVHHFKELLSEFDAKIRSLEKSRDIMQQQILDIKAIIRVVPRRREGK